MVINTRDIRPGDLTTDGYLIIGVKHVFFEEKCYIELTVFDCRGTNPIRVWCTRSGDVSWVIASGCESTDQTLRWVASRIDDDCLCLRPYDM